MLSFVLLTFTSKDPSSKGLKSFVGHQGRHRGTCCCLISQRKARTGKGRSRLVGIGVMDCLHMSLRARRKGNVSHQN